MALLSVCPSPRSLLTGFLSFAHLSVILSHCHFVHLSLIWFWRSKTAIYSAVRPAGPDTQQEREREREQHNHQHHCQATGSFQKTAPLPLPDLDDYTVIFNVLCSAVSSAQVINTWFKLQFYLLLWHLGAVSVVFASFHFLLISISILRVSKQEAKSKSRELQRCAVEDKQGRTVDSSDVEHWQTNILNSSFVLQVTAHSHKHSGLSINVNMITGCKS